MTIFDRSGLRGCMGTTKVRHAVVEDVRRNARAAAFRDPRFDPVLQFEMPHLHFEVSVLGKPRQLLVDALAEAERGVVPLVDGVIVRASDRSALFLPQVWQQLPEPRRFLAALWLKAGLPVGYWGPDVELQVFSVDKFVETPASHRCP